MNLLYTFVAVGYENGVVGPYVTVGTALEDLVPIVYWPLAKI